MKRMRAIVTGGAGFVGSAIARQLLEKNAEVLVVDNLSTGFARNVLSDAKFAPVDIREYSEVDTIFANFEPDVVFHQAAQMSVARSVKLRLKTLR